MNKPFILKPSGKDYLWGGNRLHTDFAKELHMSPLAETWECSTHRDGASYVATGEYSGMTLRQLVQLHPELLGSHHEKNKDIPILIKFIDAKQDLSVQVHPSDEYARRYEGGQLGKTEMWYVVDALPNSKLVYGLHHSADAESIRKSIQMGTFEYYLQKIPVVANDVFVVEPGTIHAICAGTLIAEIQENSNITYRLFDYDRVDKDGRSRPLHIAKALDVADLKGTEPPQQPMRVLRYEPGCASELLCRCKYFQVERLLLNTERREQRFDYNATELSFKVLLCINGCGTILTNIQEAISFYKGDCIFVPANTEIGIHGNAQLLSVSC